MPKSPTQLPASEVLPDARLEKRGRRVFTTDYKLRILKEAQACSHGELGALLRREKLYHNQLSQWRREFDQSGVSGLSKSVPGPKAKQSTEEKRITQLERENARLLHQLQLKDQCLELQKKALALLDHLDKENEP